MASMLEYILEHKDYPSSIGYGDDNGVLHGRLGFIRALVIHEGDDDKHLKAAFQEALDDSLTDCEADKHKPDMPQKAVSTCSPAEACTDARCAAPGDGGSAPTPPSAMRCGASPNAAGLRLQINSPKRPGRALTVKFRETPG